jgi:hypothetical protein
MGLLNKTFFYIGYTSASNPLTCCFFAIMLTMICCLGFLNFSLTVIIYEFKFIFRMIPNYCGYLRIQEQT